MSSAATTAIKNIERVKDAPVQRGLLLFISFDICGSTELKAVWPNDWQNVVLSFYKRVEELLVDCFEEKNLTRLPSVWKYVGDEVLFFFVPASIQEVAAVIDATWQTLEVLDRELRERIPPRIAGQVGAGVKASVWASPLTISDGSVDSLDTSKRSDLDDAREYSSGPGQRPDFIGHYVDLGFRISKYANRHFVVISAEVWFLLHEVVESLSPKDGGTTLKNIRMVGLAKDLKGIWHRRPYPIFWFRDNWNDAYEILDYDERERELAKQLGDEKFRKLSGDDLTQKMTLWKRIFTDVGFEDSVRSWSALLEHNADLVQRYEVDAASTVAEVHIAAIVVDEADNVLLLERSGNRRRNPGRWEFGCTKVQHNRDPIDSLTTVYRNDFGIEINVFGPVPCGAFSIKDSTTHHIQGYLYAATVAGIAPTVPVSTHRHAATRWTPVSELPSLRANLFPDMPDNAVRAIRMVQEFRHR